MKEYKKVIIFGGTGFIGRNLVRAFEENEPHLKVYYTGSNPCINIKSSHIKINDFLDKTELTKVLKEMSYVINLIGLAHRNEKINNANAHKVANYQITKAIAESVPNNLQKFIQLSTIGVYGGQRELGFITDETGFSPTTPYEIYKKKSEDFLIREFKNDPQKLTIIRPPLVYGNKAPGNFGKIDKLTNIPFPLPLGGIKNKRSFIYVKNLAHAILLALRFDLNSVSYNVADLEIISTSELISEICKYKKSTNLNFPIQVLRLILKVLKKEMILQKLSHDVFFDSNEFWTQVGMKPPYTFKSAINDIYQKK
ncbi:MAG: hypothetical protein CME63_14570 [Halobacteriovoraceae bacterium]|nr:hypothetical protein [Halobacteriovoraceae bacterium]|tara:strand:- start:8846 stop:9778 length:933 start_codon:yes stop_codon:yes gene_type:complete